MREPSVKKNVCKKLPKKIFLPNHEGSQTEVKINPSGDEHLDKKDTPHDDH